MNTLTDIVERPLEQTTMAETPVKENQSLSESVRQALDNYFAQLDGEHPSQLYQIVLEQIERPLLEKVMAFTGNNQSRAAKLLGISRGTLRKKLKIYDLL